MFRKKIKYQPIIAIFTPGVRYLVLQKNGQEIEEKKVEELSPNGKYVKFAAYSGTYWYSVDEFSILDVLSK